LSASLPDDQVLIIIKTLFNDLQLARNFSVWERDLTAAMHAFATSKLDSYSVLCLKLYHGRTE